MCCFCHYEGYVLNILLKNTLLFGGGGGGGGGGEHIVFVMDPVGVFPH